MQLFIDFGFIKFLGIFEEKMKEMIGEDGIGRKDEKNRRSDKERGYLTKQTRKQILDLRYLASNPNHDTMQLMRELVRH